MSQSVTRKAKRELLKKDTPVPGPQVQETPKELIMSTVKLNELIDILNQFHPLVRSAIGNFLNTCEQREVKTP